MMKKFITTLGSVAFALLIYTAPVNYSVWRHNGNQFAAGYKGFISFYTTLSLEERKEWKKVGVYDINVARNLFPDQINLWFRTNDDLDGVQEVKPLNIRFDT